jgi:peptide-methionine (R)-S-oxide reductase
MKYLAFPLFVVVAAVGCNCSTCGIGTSSADSESESSATTVAAKSDAESDDAQPTPTPDAPETKEKPVDTDSADMPADEVPSKDDLRSRLTPEQFAITQQCGTEPPGTGKWLYNKKEGTYTCIVCDAPLFSSDAKYDSGSGWPSFWQVLESGNIEEVEDRTLGMVRTEVRCKKCGAHLGHVFPDGPREKTGMRYCINSVSLDFEEEKE